MTKFEIFDDDMQEEKEMPTWISSYNFICLTNLLSILQEYGLLHNMWEGGGSRQKDFEACKAYLDWVLEELASEYVGSFA